MARNKSRKRLLHEQRVEIASLRRQIKWIRMLSRDPQYGKLEHEIVTLRRDFLVPLNLVGAETMRDHEAYKTMKEIIQHLVNLLEIRYEDVPALHSGKYTVILRAVRPSISQAVSEDFMKSIIDDLLHKPEPLIEWFPADNEIFYGGIRDGGRKFYETHVLGNLKQRTVSDMARYIDAEKCREYFDKEYKELRQQR